MHASRTIARAALAATLVVGQALTLSLYPVGFVGFTLAGLIAPAYGLFELGHSVLYGGFRNLSLAELARLAGDPGPPLGWVLELPALGPFWAFVTTSNVLVGALVCAVAAGLWISFGVLVGLVLQFKIVDPLRAVLDAPQLR